MYYINSTTLVANVCANGRHHRETQPIYSLSLPREHVPIVAPDGRLFPQSLLMSRGPMTFPLYKATPTHVEIKGQDESNVVEMTDVEKSSEPLGFPHNIEFKQVSIKLDTHCHSVTAEEDLQ